MSHELARRLDCEGRSQIEPPVSLRLAGDVTQHSPVLAGTIADWPEPKLAYEPGVGTISTRTVTLDDGSRFDVRKIVPERQRSLISADFMTPLGTQVAGFNTYVGYALAKVGVHTRIIGSNRKNGHGLLHDAQAALDILEEDDRQTTRNPTCEPGRSVSLGYSMGSMKAMALMGLAPAMDRSIDVGIGLDPGPANKVAYSPGEALRFGAWSVEQALEIPQIFMSSWHETNLPRTLARARHMVPTVSLNPRSLWNAAGALHTIASGEAGDFPSKIPPDAAIVMHFFNSRTSYNQAAAYADLLQGHANARLIQEDGSHLAGARLTAVKSLTAKTVHSLDLIKDNATPAELSEALDYPILSSR